MDEIKRNLPFPLLGIHSDNDAAFINGLILRYCNEKKITFTRSRPYKKNDNCHIEQKNYTTTRRVAGYSRYDTEEEVRILNEMYIYYELYVNFFQPTMKLKEKIREGSKITKRYDKARTPYERVLEREEIKEEDKKKLKKIYEDLNPMELKEKVEKLQNKLIKIATKNIRNFEKRKNLEYNFNEAMVCTLE